MRSILALEDAPPPEGVEVFWRAEVRVGKICYLWFRVLRRTPKGAWLQHGSRERWAPVDGRRASESREVALSRLKARTRSYLRHSRRALATATARAQLLGLYTQSRGGLLQGLDAW